jgi:hypothetical protein
MHFEDNKEMCKHGRQDSFSKHLSAWQGEKPSFPA